MRRSRCIALLLPLALFAASCAPRCPVEGFPPLERHWPAQERVFRHTVRIDFPGTAPPFSFDGIMRLGKTGAGFGGRPEIRVVCLGAFGLTLCDMTITPDGYRTDTLHPSLAKVPHVAEHIALCVTSVWFAALPLAEERERTGVFRGTYGRTLLEHTAGEDGRRTVRALGPDVFWTVVRMPAAILFRNECEGYTVTVRFIADTTGEHGT